MFVRAGKKEEGTVIFLTVGSSADKYLKLVQAKPTRSSTNLLSGDIEALPQYLLE